MWCARRGRLLWAAIMACGLIACVMAPARAQAQPAELSSASARAVQYVFIIDDSGSMRVNTRSGPAADIDRLAVFAVRSLLSMLDDADEATIVRLNGPDEQEQVTPIGALSRQRAALEAQLALTGPVAAYAGKQTPCAPALDAARAALNRAWRPGVSQVVFFLTDGECTGPPPEATSFLKGVSSHKEELFKFYFLRFSGRDYTRSLARFAELTGGQTSEVDASDPTSILQPFANALSRSQGYEAHLLVPGQTTLPAHGGARRVRLLAVAPDGGQPLSFQITPERQGVAPVALGAPVAGVHQYEDGRRYRYVALDYKPGDTPVKVSVSGAGARWKVVAVPEYRLHVDVAIEAGRCGEGGDAVQFVEVGAAVCATVRLMNEEGRVVSEAVAGRGAEAVALYTAPDAKVASPLPLNRQGQEATFTLERVNLERGDHIFAPRITLPIPGASGATIALKGASRTLQVSSQSVQPVPARFELGELVPGDERYEELTFNGNFPASRARLVVEGRQDVPECVTFSLSNVAEGEPQAITANQAYTLTVRVAPYCGHATYKREVNTSLLLEFDRAASSRPIPTVVLPVRLTLVNQLALPDALRVKLEPGAREEIALTLGGNHKKDVSFKALLPPPQARTRWPKGALLEVVFLDERGEPLEAETSGARSVLLKGAPGAPARLRVQARAESCCDVGKWVTELALIPTAGSREVIRVPVEVQVVGAGPWRCWGPRAIMSLIGLLLLLLVVYAVLMIKNSSFINRDLLASKLVPLRWDDWGEPTAYGRAAEDVKRMVRKSMPWYARAWNWIRANPLKIGLPGGSYAEAVTLYLEPARDVNRSRIVLTPERDLAALMRANPEQGVGRIFATAQGGLNTFGVPDREGRLGRLQYVDEMAGLGGGSGGWGDEPEEDKREVVRLRRHELLNINSEREPDGAAGWRVG